MALIEPILTDNCRNYRSAAIKGQHRSTRKTHKTGHACQRISNLIAIDFVSDVTRHYGAMKMSKKRLIYFVLTSLTVGHPGGQLVKLGIS